MQKLRTSRPINVYYLKPIAKYIEWIEFTSDFGMQNAPFISRELFNKYFKKHYIELFGAIKKVAPNVKVFHHSCGAIRELIPEFIDAGLDILDPIQPLATGMDSFELKKEFGRDLIFHAGIDIQQAMRGTVEDVRQEVLTRMKALAPGGGYICCPTNHLQPDVSIENFLALYKYAKEYGTYPINL
jgi:uroporphyrinogen decarboxylase